MIAYTWQGKHVHVPKFVYIIAGELGGERLRIINTQVKYQRIKLIGDFKTRLICSYCIADILSSQLPIQGGQEEPLSYCYMSFPPHIKWLSNYCIACILIFYLTWNLYDRSRGGMLHCRPSVNPLLQMQ